MSDWQYLPGVDQPGAPVRGGVQALFFRSQMDARLAMQGDRIPAAEYPDGYLGTINSRRSDRMLDQLKKNLNQRSYQRGVHKGEKVDPADYLWPPEFGPMSGLQRQSMVAVNPEDGTLNTPRAAPLMTISEQVLTYGAPQRRLHGAGSLTTNPPNATNPSDWARLQPNWK